MKIAAKNYGFERKFSKFLQNHERIAKINGAKDCKFEFGAVQRNANLVDIIISKSLQNASFLAIVAVHRAENEPLKVWQPASL